MAVALVLQMSPAVAQAQFHTSCRQWEDGTETARFPCFVSLHSDGRVDFIRTPFDYMSPHIRGWARGLRNPECIRSTGRGYQIAICPVTD